MPGIKAASRYGTQPRKNSSTTGQQQTPVWSLDFSPDGRELLSFRLVQRCLALATGWQFTGEDILLRQFHGRGPSVFRR